MGGDCPYPRNGRKYVIARANLPFALGVALKTAEVMDRVSRDSLSLAEQWEREGGVPPVMIERVRRSADNFGRSRDRELAKLWTFHGATPPDGLRFEDLEVSSGGGRAG